MNDHDTAEYRATLNAAKLARRAKMATFFASYDLGLNNLHEVYVKSPNGLTKMAECRGTRAAQVELRRSVRQKNKLSADQVLLFSNGRLVKSGIN